MVENDPYKILNVTRKSSPQDILKSFKKLRYKYHPDRPKGNRKLYDEVVEAFEKIKKYPQKYLNVNDFIKTYKGSEEQHNDILKAYEKYKGNMRKVLDSLILVEDKDEEDIREILNREINNGKIFKYKNFDKKIKKRKNENKKAEELAHKLGIDLEMSLEDILNRQDSRQEEMIKKLEEKYGNIKSIKK